MKRTYPLVAALLLSAGLAHADVTDAVVADLQAQGYSNIEITRRATTLSVEAVLNGQKLERVVDRTSGAVLKEEISPVGSDGSVGAGVGVKLGNDEDAEDSDSDDDRNGMSGPDDEGSDDNGDGGDQGQDGGDSGDDGDSDGD